MLREERISYMVQHFWNEQAVGDTLNFKSPKLLLDYLYLVKQTDESLREHSIREFMDLSAKYEDSFGWIVYWLDRILYDSLSPHYDEVIYLKFLDAILSSEADTVMKLLPQERWKIVMKNQIGKLACDFSFTDKGHQGHRLYDIDAKLLLIVFNNPECSLCEAAEDSIQSSEVIRKLLQNDSLKILAVTPNAEFEEWAKKKYPESWMTGIDTDGTIMGEPLYDIQRLPALYLLDEQKRVLVKEANVERVVNYLNSYVRSSP